MRKITLYKFIFILFIFSIIQMFFESCKTQYDLSLSDEIFEIQKVEFPQAQNPRILKLFRDQSNCFNILRSDISNDTLFLLERNGIQGDYFMTLWNKKDIISYTNITGKFTISKDSLFIKQIMIFVSDWNIQVLEDSAKSQSNILSPEFIYATRIIIKKKQKTIDCFRFDEFYSFE